VAAAHAGFFPTVGLNAGATRAQINSTGTVKLGTTDTLGLGASWEPDLWGAVRRSVEAGTAGAQASADDLAAARLSIQTTLAQDYLQIRVIDLQRELYVYAATTAPYARALELTQHQYAAGTVLRSDVALAESQLRTAEAQAVDLDAQRSQLEHAVAVLTGQAPASFSLPPLAASAQTTARRESTLRCAMSNLLQNAIEHSPPGAQITVTLREEPAATWIMMSNPGAAIDEQHLQHLFDRFYRVDAARNDGGEHHGHGLGLAIVNGGGEHAWGQVSASSEGG